MSFWDTIKDVIKNKGQFMSWAGGTIILMVLLYCFYEQIQINYLFSKGKMSSVVFERMTYNIRDMLRFSFEAIILYFFSKTISTNTNDKL